MMMGQVVAIDGEPFVLWRSPRAYQVSGHGGMPHQATLWEFVKRGHGSVRTYVTHTAPNGSGVTQRSDVLPPMVPACRSCKAARGWPCDHLADRIEAMA